MTTHRDHNGVRILIGGGAGMGNAGDEALLLASVQIVRRAIGDAPRIDVMTPDAEVTTDTLRGQRAHLVPTLRKALFRADSHYAKCDQVFRTRWHTFRSLIVGASYNLACEIVAESDLLGFADRKECVRLLDSLNQCTALVIHGGGILTSYTRSRLWEQALLSEIASSWNKKILLRSHQWGPFTSNEDRELVARIARRAVFLSSRDKAQSSVTMNQICPDVAVEDQVDDAIRVQLPDHSEKLLKHHGLVPRRYICVGLRENHGVGVDWRTTIKVGRICQMASETLGLPMVLVPQNRPDIDRLMTLGAMLRPRLSTLILTDPFRDPIALAENASMTIATPHHSLIFALRGGTPVLSPVSGEYYTFKNQGSMRVFGLEHSVVNVDQDEEVWLAKSMSLINSVKIQGSKMVDNNLDTKRRLVAAAELSDQRFADLLNAGSNDPKSRPYS